MTPQQPQQDRPSPPATAATAAATPAATSTPSSPPKPSPLPPGIYAPTQAFFQPTTPSTLDLPTTARHAVRLARAGITGIVTNGSNGEAAHLSPAERATVTRTTRAALDGAGFAHVPVLSGASHASLEGTVDLVREAREAGAVGVLVLVPSAFGWAMREGGAVERFFEGVVREGGGEEGVEVVVYNYPAAAGGLDLDSDLLGRLAEVGVAGVKFTCGNVGKLARVVGEREVQGDGRFRCFSGVADAIVPALAVGGHGGIVGAANVFPRACVQVYKLFEEGRWEEARVAQQRLARADWAMTKRAIPGFKSVLQKYHGYGGIPRLPVLPLSEEEEEKLFAEVEEMMAFEAGLEDFGKPSQ